MEFLADALVFLTRLDRHLLDLVRDLGGWTYALLAAVVFCETGLVVTPFLPGDSLLFAAGAVAALGSFDLVPLVALLTAAAILGDALNYTLGSTFASRYVVRSRLVDPRRLEQAERFYRRHGGKTIVIARFVPFLRTFAPFVAGMARMPYPRFAAYNVLGGMAWVFLFTIAGYVFGNVPAVRENFSFVLVAVIALSLVPLLASALRGRPHKTVAQPGSLS